MTYISTENMKTPIKIDNILFHLKDINKSIDPTAAPGVLWKAPRPLPCFQRQRGEWQGGVTGDPGESLASLRMPTMIRDT